MYNYTWLVVWIITTLVIVLHASAKSTGDSPAILLTLCDNSSNFDTRVPLHKYRNKFLNGFERQHEQTLVLLKSLLIAQRHFRQKGRGGDAFDRNEPLRVLLVGNNVPRMDAIVAEVGTWNSNYTAPLQLTVLQASYPEEFRWMESFFSPCASLRLLAHLYLPTDLRRVLYVDTDFIFLADVRGIWHESLRREELNPNMYFALSRDIYELNKCLGADAGSVGDTLGIPDNKRDMVGLNTGLMFMQLERWRAKSHEWMAWIRSMKPHEAQIRTSPCPVQVMFTSFALSHKNALRKLPCSWNFMPTFWETNQCVAMDGSKPIKTVHALHGNRGSFWKDIHDNPIPRILFKHYAEANLVGNASNFSISRFKRRLAKSSTNVTKQCRGVCPHYLDKARLQIMASVQRLS